MNMKDYRKECEESRQVFLYWLNQMELGNDLEYTANLLDTTVDTIKGYLSGRFKVAESHLTMCDNLLHLKKKGKKVA